MFIFVQPENVVPLVKGGAGGLQNHAAVAVLAVIVVDPGLGRAFPHVHHRDENALLCGFRDQTAIAVALGQKIHGFFTSCHRLGFFTGKGGGIDVEPGIVGLDLPIAGDVDADAVVALGQLAVEQTPVDFIAGIEAVSVVLTQFDAADDVVVAGIGHQLGQSFPAFSVPFFQEVRPILIQRGAVPGNILHVYAVVEGHGGAAVHIRHHSQPPVGVLGHDHGLSRREGCFTYLGFDGNGGLRHLGGAGHQAHCDKGDGHDAEQACPEAGLAVIQDGLDAAFHADFPEGHRRGGVVDTVGAAI